MYQGKFSQSNLETAPETTAEELKTNSDVLTAEEPEYDKAAVLKAARQARERRREAEQKRKLRKNKRLFYTVYFSFVAVLVVTLLILMIPLRNWLVRFESTQPDQQCQEIYDSIFAQQDWGHVYDTAALEGTTFETRDEYARYMQAKVEAAEDKTLSYYETSAGLSSDHKYIVQLGGEKIATFTLTSSINSKNGNTEWRLASLDLAVDRSNSISVQRLPGQTVLINGKTVSDEYIVRNIYTEAENYLPEGVHGLNLQELYVDGLLAEPIVEVLDANGNAVPTVYDAESNTYTPDLSGYANMTPAEEEIILGAAKANALFAIRAVGTGELRKYFDSNTQIYKDICNTPTFIQSFASYQFAENVTAISDFYRYNDNIFSARVTLRLDITRKNGTVKSLDMNTTYIFTKNATGTYMVSNITNVSLQDQTQQVRLRFDCNGTIVSTAMVDATAKTISLPEPTINPGEEFLGWATRSVADNGQITMTIVFVPGEGGRVPADLTLEPMTLYAVYEAEEAVQ